MNGRSRGKRHKEPNSHIPPQQLNLRRNYRLPHPHHRKNPTEHHAHLIAPRPKTQQQTQRQTKHQRAPKIPIPQPLTHRIPLDQTLHIRNPGHHAPQLLSRGADPLFAKIRVRAAQTVRIEHRPAEEIFRVEDLPHFGPDGEEIPRESLPHGFVDGVVRGAAIFAGDAGGQVGFVEGAGGGASGDVAGEGGAGGGGLEGIV
ncbi:hypothetical protein ACMFMF_011964 [Clarireedia jacksonii]